MAKSEVIAIIGEENYEDFIEWGFTQDPGTHKGHHIPFLWKHHEDFPVNGNDEVLPSIIGMCALYMEKRHGKKEEE